MRRLIVVLVVTAGALGCGAQIASADYYTVPNQTTQISVPPDSIVHGQIAGCNWSSQSGVFLAHAFAVLSYQGPQCTPAGYGFNDAQCACVRWDPANVTLSPATLSLSQSYGLLESTVDQGGRYVVGRDFANWLYTTIHPCGVWPGVAWICQNVGITNCQAGPRWGFNECGVTVTGSAGFAPLRRPTGASALGASPFAGTPGSPKPRTGALGPRLRCVHLTAGQRRRLAAHRPRALRRVPVPHTSCQLTMVGGRAGK